MSPLSRIRFLIVLPEVILTACGGNDGTAPPMIGSLEVTTSTTGSTPDPDGYMVTVGGASDRAIGVNGATTFTNVPVGEHDVALMGVASNCTVAGSNPRTVTVVAGGTASTRFEVDCVPEVPASEIEVLLDVTGDLSLPDPPAGSVPVATGLFMSASRVGQTEALDRARQILAETNAILTQCAMHVVVEAAQVISVPQHLNTVQGNEIGSWGGHPPASVGDPDLFMYYEDERLTDETRVLFSHGKLHTTRNSIAIFVVDGIEYYIGTELTGAAGLSFPPVIYHHSDDYPIRNSVLATSPGGELVAHELGHMLLNTGDHWGEGFNLMLGGRDLTSDQCERMHENLERLYADAAIPDPGPPTTTAEAIAMVSGGDQVGKAGEPMDLPFAVRVTDAQGEGVRHVHVTWDVASGAGGLPSASRTGSDGITEVWFTPTALGVSIATAEVAGLEGSPVIFSIEAPVLVVVLRPAFDPWEGYSGDPVFTGPEGSSDVTVPVGTTVEWSVIGVEAAHVTSVLEPAGGQPFDSGILHDGERFEFVPDVAGTWVYEDRVSGATGTLTVH